MNRIGGLKQDEACRRLGLHRSTLHRMRQTAEWPGDDAAWEFIQAYVSAHKSTRGRRARTAPAGPAAAVVGAEASAAAVGAAAVGSLGSEELAELQSVIGLDEELKRTIIEKNKAMIRQYQLKCLSEYRRGVRRELQEALEIIYREAEAQGLTRVQVEALRMAVRQAQQQVRTGQRGTWQPELGLDEAAPAAPRQEQATDPQPQSQEVTHAG